MSEPQRSEYAISNFDLHWNWDESRKNRGVCIYTKNELQAKEITQIFDTNEQLWLNIKTPSDEWTLGGFYRSPNTHSALNDTNLLNSMESNIKTSGKALIVGDFNTPNIRWVNGTGINTVTSRSTNFDDKLLQRADELFLYQHIDQPTRHRDDQHHNILDHVYTKDKSHISNIDYQAPLGKSDHVVIVFELALNANKPNPEQHTPKFNWNRGDYDAIRDSLGSIDWDITLEGLNTEDTWDTLCHVLHRCITKNVPLTRPNNKSRPVWLTKTVTDALKSRDAAWKRYLHSRTTERFETYKDKRNKATASIRRSKQECERRLAANIKDRPKAFWSFIRSKTSTRELIGKLTKDDGTTAENDLDKAETLNNFFARVFTVEDNNNPKPSTRTNASVDTVIFDEETIIKHLKKLKTDKSAGPDNISPRLLKECATEISRGLHLLFSRSLEEGKLPMEWKQATVTPLFKKGSKSDPGNYRPISLTSVVGKVMERIIRDSIMTHLDTHDLIADQQYGFRSGRSCQLQLLEALDKWSDHLDNGRHVDIIFLDFSKAFDTVPHRRLLSKLNAHGITGQLHKWIQDFLTARTQRVHGNGATSSWKDVTSGVPQGSVLGPILFIVYVNDLPCEVINEARLFADDTKASIGFTYEVECESLQDDINRLVNWSERWQLSFNAKKCKSMHLGTKNPRHTYSMKDIEGNETMIAATDEEKDLGVYLDPKLSFKTHIAKVISKANSIAGLVIRNFKHLDTTTFSTLYKALIRPVLEYASPVWSPQTSSDSDRLEGVQRRATRAVKALKKTSYSERLKRLGLPTLAYRRKRADMVQVYKITHQLDRLDPDTLFTRETDTRTRGHSLKLKKERCNSRKRASTFRHRVTDTWNSLPEEVVQAENINSFKSNLNTHWKYQMSRFC